MATMAIRCIFIAFLLLSLHQLSTLAAASPFSSDKISALSPVSVQGRDTATGIAPAKPRKLKGGGGRGGSRGRSIGLRGFFPLTGAYGNRSAAPRRNCLGMTTLTVLTASLMATLLP